MRSEADLIFEDVSFLIAALDDEQRALKNQGPKDWSEIDARREEQ